MRIVVTGASGNVGTSVLMALAGDPGVDEIVGVARRLPRWENPKTTWVAADIGRAELADVFAGADAVVHLAWLIQPSRDLQELERVNVLGSRRVFEAAATAGVGTLVHASSIGVYSAGPKDVRVDESHPREGIPTSFYSRHKAAAERALDEVEAANPALRVVRLRPGLVFKREAAAEIRRWFAGPFLPSALVHPALLPIVPVTHRLVVQAVHSLDLGQAYRLVVMDPQARGAYNVAAEPVLDPEALGRALGARPVHVPPAVFRKFAEWTWKARLQPTPAGWFDLAEGVPVMDVSRIRALGWTPQRDAESALLELMAGMRASAGLDTPPLAPHAGGPLRIRELLTGVGKRLTT
jgi:UDP-glucose 4-epimerase